jgi:outer membrane immunogenic protein
MRRLSIALIAAASTIALTQMASAADLPRKAPVYVPPPPVADWSGVYVGLEGGYGWGHQNFDPAIDPFGTAAIAYAWERVDLFPTIDSVRQHGWLFGGFAGVQKQWGSWVLGIEADFDGADIKGSATSSAVANNVLGCNPCELGTVTRTVTVDSKIDELGSVRGKVGFVLAPDWLIYGTGGLAFAHVKTTVSLSERVQYVTWQEGPDTASASGGASLFGWAAGAGVDWKFWHDAGSAWILGVEYLHYGFGDHTITLADNSSGHTAPGWDIAFNSKQSVDTIKGRISYLFSIH